MAQDIFLKLAGIDGESQDAKHKGEIELTNWGWSIHQNSSMQSGSGGGSGKATVSDLTFDHRIDRATPNLLKHCLVGKHIDTATLVVRKAGGNPQEAGLGTERQNVGKRRAPRQTTLFTSHGLDA